MAPKKRKTKGRGRMSTRTALPGFDPSTSAFVLKDSEERWFVEVILAARRCRTPRSSQTEYKPMHDGGRWEYLVKWAGFSEDDNTWEPAISLLSCARLVHSFWSRFPIHTDGHETYFCKGDKAGLLLTPPSDWIEREKALFQTLANEQDVAKQNADPLNHAREAILELLPRHLFQTPTSDLDSASAVGGPSTTTHEANAAFDDVQSQNPLAPLNGNEYLRWNSTQVRQHARLYGHHQNPDQQQHARALDPEGDFDSKLGDFGALTLGMGDDMLEGAARLGGHDVAPKSSPTEAKMPQPHPLVAPPQTPLVHDPVDDGHGDTTMVDASVSQSQSQPEGDPIATIDGDDFPLASTSVSSTTPSTSASALPMAAAKPTQTSPPPNSTTASAGSNVVAIDVPCTAMEWGQVCSLLLESGSERRVQNAEQAEAVGAGVEVAHDDGDQDVSELPRARDPAARLPKSIPVAPSPPMSPETTTPIVFGQPHRLLLPHPQPDPRPQPSLQTQTQVLALQIPIHDVVDQPRPSSAIFPLPNELVPPSPNPEPNDIDIEVDKRDEGQVARELVPSVDEASPTPSPSTEPALSLPVLVEDEQAQACITEDLPVFPQQKDVTANEIVVESDETRLQHPFVLGHDEDTQLEQARSRVAEESFPSHERDETPTPPASASVGPTSMPTPTATATSTSSSATADNVAGQEDNQDVAMMSSMGGEEEEEEVVRLESMEVMVEGDGQLEEHDELQEHSSGDQNVDDGDTMVVDQPQVDAAVTADAPSAASVVPTSNTNPVPVPIPNPFPAYPKPSTTPRDISLPPITTFSRLSYFASSLSSPSTSSSSPISPVSSTPVTPVPLSPTAHTVPSPSESLSLPPTLLPSPHVSQKRKREHVPIPAPLDPTREPRRPKAPRTGSRIKLLDSSVGASLPGARGRTDVVSVAGNARKRMIGERAYASGLTLLSTEKTAGWERGERDVDMDGVEQTLPQPQPTTPKAPVSSIWSPSTDDWSNWSTPYPLAEPRNIPAATGTGRRAEMDVDVDAETRFEVHSGSWSYASTSPTTTSAFKTGSWTPSQTAGFGFARPKAQTQTEPRRPEPRQGFHVAGGNNVPLGWSSVSSARPSSSSSSSGWSSTETVKKDWFARGTTNKDRNSTTNVHNHTPASHTTTRKDAHWPSLSTFAETSRNAMPTVTSSTHTNTTKTTNASTFRWPSLSEFV